MSSSIAFLNFGTVFLTTVRLCKIRKAHCSPPLVGEDNSMVLTSHSVPFPATRDLRSLVARNGTWWETKTISFSYTSDGKEYSWWNNVWSLNSCVAMSINWKKGQEIHYRLLTWREKSSMVMSCYIAVAVLRAAKKWIKRCNHSP